MDSQNLKPKIFLSYAHVDLDYAKKIYDDLKRYGLEIWFDKKSLLPGQDWENEIKKAIRECDYFIALLSDKCLSKRGFVHSELKLSFEIIEKYFPSDTGIFIIPVRLDECKPSDAYERLGRLHWIDVFPENQYQNGLRKILQVIIPGFSILRSQPGEFSIVEANEKIISHDFFEINRNPSGKGIQHQYKKLEIENKGIIIDEATNLMWQQSGSSEFIDYENAVKWVSELNKKMLAGFSNWRLPTLEEAMSIMEPEKNISELFIHPGFESRQTIIWTSDKLKDQSRIWAVYYGAGFCFHSAYFNNIFVRAVRSVQSSNKQFER